MPTKKLHGFIHPALIIALLTVALAIVVGYFISANIGSNKKNSQNSQDEASQSSSENFNIVDSTNTVAILNSIGSYLNMSEPLQKGTYFRDKEFGKGWVRDSAGVLAGDLLILPVTFSHSLDPSESEKQMYLDLDKNISNYFLRQGFTATNTSDTSNESRIYIEKSFKKGETICQTKVASPSGYSTEIFCGKADGSYEQLVKELEPVISKDYEQLQKELGPISDQKTIPFAIEMVSGNFARGTYRIHWVAEKTPTGWKKLYNAMESPLCVDVDKYNIPEEIDNCYVNGQTGEMKYE